MSSIRGDERDRATTVVLLRHADIDQPAGGDVALNARGRERAGVLVHVLGDASVAVVYATEYQRTQQTAGPLAEHLGLHPEVRGAAAWDDLAAEILNDHVGETSVVVSHSNVVPGVVRALGGPDMADLADDEFDNLFWVSVPARGRAGLHHLRYGAAT